jgi:hypothetical protein
VSEADQVLQAKAGLQVLGCTAWGWLQLLQPAVHAAGSSCLVCKAAQKVLQGDAGLQVCAKLNGSGSERRAG